MGGKALSKYCTIRLTSSPLEVFAEVQGKPHIQIESCKLSPKAMSKLVFMQREDVERIVLQHISLVDSRLEIDEEAMLEV